MTITKLKTKNQLTIPQEIVSKLHMKINELFTVEIKDNYIKLTPVDIEPKYTASEIAAMNQLAESQKGKGKLFKPGKEFTKYINRKKPSTKKAKIPHFGRIKNT